MNPDISTQAARGTASKEEFAARRSHQTDREREGIARYALQE
jgi:hypothetical protein